MPLTSVIMIFEITRDYSIIVPLMIANLISYFISSRLQEEPIYEALQHQDGMHLPTGARAREVLLTVGNAYRPETQPLAATETVSHALAAVDAERGAWPVVEPAGLRGMVTRRQLEEAVKAGRGDDSLSLLVPDPGPGEKLNTDSFPHLHTDHSLDFAMRRLAESKMKVLPVVSRTAIRELKGTVSVADILDAYGMGEASPAAEVPITATPRAQTRLYVGALTALIAVALMAGFLNYFYRAERASRAQRYFDAGNKLYAQERVDEAIAQYRDALSISHRPEARLALGLALVKAGRMNEASIYLNEVLRENPGSGPANLGMAQIEVPSGDIDRATLHFQRAIYGAWPDKPEEHRFQARLQLVDVLLKAGRKAEAQAQLMAAAAAVANQPALRKQVGIMLLENGLPREAATLFREMVQHDHTDAGAYTGLGEAEFALGRFSEARDAYHAVLKIDPSNREATRRLDLCDRILALDPGLRGLSSAERYRRSREILSRVADTLVQCVGGESSVPDELKPEFQSARTALAVKRPASTSDAAEQNMETAKHLWTARPSVCRVPPSAEDPLVRILAAP